MKWTKEAVIIVGTIYATSYIYGKYIENELSDKIFAHSVRACQKAQHDYCPLIEVFHKECFSTNYRSKYKAMHFFQDSYNRCLQEEINNYLKTEPK